MDSEIRLDYRLGVAFIAVCTLGCEPLRPVVGPAPPTDYSAELVRARELAASHAPLTQVTASLRTVIAGSVDEDEVEEARRDLVRTQVEWFQWAHIARDLLPGLEGNDTVFNALRQDLEQGRPSTNATLNARVSNHRRTERHAVRSPLFFMQQLTRPGESAARPVDVKRRLVEELARLERSAEEKTRTYAVAARRFLTLESAWRYGRTWRSGAARVGELLGVMRGRQLKGLADNVWLLLKLSFHLSLEDPKVPRRPVLDSLATVLGAESLERRESPREALLRLAGDVAGDTPVERLWYAWKRVRQKVDQVLDEDGVAPLGTDGRYLWLRLSRYLELHDAPHRPTAAQLHALGASDREPAVAEWWEALEGPPLDSNEAIDRLEAIAREESQRVGRRPATLAMTVLTLEEIVTMRLGPRIQGRSVRLVAQGVFLERSLVLPDGVVLEGFPLVVERCILDADEEGCLRALVLPLVRRSYQPE